MRYHRLGHVNQIFVKVGDKVQQGDKIATNGTGNGQWLSHCHYDIFTHEQSNWERFNIGWTKVETLNVWTDPRPWMYIVMPYLHHFGWEWLEWAKYNSGSAWHPGVDLNGQGAGDADYDLPLYAPCDGEIQYIYSGSGSNSGWGRIIIIKEVVMADKIYHIDNTLVKQLQRLWEDFDGDKESDHEKMADLLEEYFDKEAERAEKTRLVVVQNTKLTKELETLSNEIAGIKDGNTYKWSEDKFEMVTCEGGILEKAWKWMVDILWSAKPKE